MQINSNRLLIAFVVLIAGKENVNHGKFFKQIRKSQQATLTFKLKMRL